MVCVAQIDGHDNQIFDSREDAEAYAQSIFPDCDFAPTVSTFTVEVYATSGWFDDVANVVTALPVGRIQELGDF